MATAPRLIEHYRKSVVPEMMKEFGYASVMAVPRLSKIVINMGVGAAKDDIKILKRAINFLQYAHERTQEVLRDAQEN